ncbi:hypothetical protein [Microbulbifer sp. DLAB2-AA]|uniref:hypothetical protein n=1 Tax=Microbulbifer sp. DLAB2-AA TaxID=3243394 RepID=UPI00403A77DB
MKKVIGLAFALMSVNTYSSCAGDEYSKYLNAQNKAFMYAASEMSKADSENYNKVKEFVSLHIKSNNLQVYIAKKFEQIAPEQLNTDSIIGKYVINNSIVLADGTTAPAWDEILKDDYHYTSERKALEHFNDFYMMGGFSSDVEEKAKFETFYKARNIFNNYLMQAPTMKIVTAAFSTKIKDVCSL